MAFQFHTKVAGVTFDNRQRLIRRMTEGESISLQRDPRNEYDKNAIMVINSAGNQIGFISKELAAVMAPNMDRGIGYTAVVCNINADMPGCPVGVNLLITQEED
ncbi:MAG: HIRAN domain-containing protein [Oscillospiraceae bacterium]|uniref:HIRAN domain-containing protein n=1 Tax=Oscillibacter ruminantium TaxID=1263547 RepID=UPI0005908EEA|nr:HIRAN domain-containing protein [Oscillibacter ruminantium]MDD3228906.1 HIRAN domain-containing protein [Oscillospiraceae bacterium]